MELYSPLGHASTQKICLTASLFNQTVTHKPLALHKPLPQTVTRPLFSKLPLLVTP